MMKANTKANENGIQHCLVPGCDRPVRSRGLCNSCYTSACYLVRQGRTTWAQLEKGGKVAPAHNAARRLAHRWFTE